MRKPLIIANWKMNTTLADATVLTTSIKNAITDLDINVVLCPPFTWLYPMAEILERSPKNIELGAQNMWFTEKGAMTGEISPLMVKTLAKYVILGHSERRSHFHEDNSLVNDKVHSALEHKLIPIVCVGENKKMGEEKHAGRPTQRSSESNITNQLKGSLKKISRNDIDDVIIAYEPVWAIGTGNAATGAYAAGIVADLRKVIADMFGKLTSERIRILYGGSVTEENVREFIYQPEIDGVLAGGASLRASEFIKICREAAGRE